MKKEKKIFDFANIKYINNNFENTETSSKIINLICKKDNKKIEAKNNNISSSTKIEKNNNVSNIIDTTYQNYLSCKAFGEYQKAIDKLNIILKYTPNDVKIIKEMGNTKNLYNQTCQEINNIHNKTKKFIEEKNYHTALININNAIRLAKKQNLDLKIYENTKSEIENLINNKTPIKKRKEKEIPNKYKEQLEKAIKEHDIETISTIITNLNKKRIPEEIMAPIYDALKKEGERLVKQTISTVINWFEFGLYEESEKILLKALNVEPNNEDLKALLYFSKNQKIDVSNCNSKKCIQLLKIFDKERTKQFINLRRQNKIWYNIENFALDFDLQPHETLMIEDKIYFPPKPKLKKGRKIDW